MNLYYNQNIGRNQSVTINATGTYSDASYSWSYDGKSPYSYTSDGDSWSLFAEGIYENRMRMLTFSSGIQYFQKYISNKYLGDAEAINTIRNSQVYAYAQVKGNLAALEYTFGAGVSRLYYHQANDAYEYWLWRPELSLAYQFLEKFKLRYYLRMYQNPPRLEYLGDVDVRNNELEVSRGNSALFPARVLEQSFTLSCQLPSFYAEIETSYRNNYHCVMSQINREIDESGNTNFIFTRENQRRISMFYVNGYTRFAIVSDKLTFAATGGFSVSSIMEIHTNIIILRLMVHSGLLHIWVILRFLLMQVTDGVFLRAKTVLQIFVLTVLSHHISIKISSFH